MQITERYTINAPVAKVWNILATDFQDLGRWASAVSHSASNTNLPEGELGRVCHTELGTVAETITQMDEEAGVFSYRTERPPFFIRSAANTLLVRADGPERTRLEVQAEVQLVPFFGRIARRLIQRRLHTLVAVFMEELKYYAETGNIHPRKAEAQAKATRRTGRWF